MLYVTLKHLVNALRQNKEIYTGYKPQNWVFNDDYEKELAEYCNISVDLYFGISTKDLRKLRLQFASLHKFPEKLNETELAREDWLAVFLRRNQELSRTFPGPTNFNRVNVGKFFDNLSAVITQVCLRTALHIVESARKQFINCT